MTLTILTFVLGALENNTFLVADQERRLALVIDPSFDIEAVIQEAQQRQWQISKILLTHAHFDHLAGVGQLQKECDPAPEVFLHPEDKTLYQQQGGARLFGFSLDPLPAYTQPLAHEQLIQIGGSSLQVRHTPGHSPGHVVFYVAEVEAAFCGDLVFAGSVGRTDLPGGSSLVLMQSIRNSILTLPSTTRLLCGHGPETTVGKEIISNPYF